MLVYKLRATLFQSQSVSGSSSHLSLPHSYRTITNLSFNMSMLTFATLSAVLVALCSADTFVPSTSQFSSGFVQQPLKSANFIPVLARSQEHNADGSFNHKYQSADGQSVQESGVARRNHENDGNVIVKSGSYQFTSPEGITFNVQYTADENGFHPVATHLPTSVPVPPVRF